MTRDRQPQGERERERVEHQAESQQLDVSISAYLSDIIENFYDIALSWRLERKRHQTKEGERESAKAGAGGKLAGVIGVRGC